MGTYLAGVLAPAAVRWAPGSAGSGCGSAWRPARWGPPPGDAPPDHPTAKHTQITKKKWHLKSSHIFIQVQSLVKNSQIYIKDIFLECQIRSLSTFENSNISNGFKRFFLQKRKQTHPTEKKRDAMAIIKQLKFDLPTKAH